MIHYLNLFCLVAIVIPHRRFPAYPSPASFRTSTGLLLLEFLNNPNFKRPPFWCLHLYGPLLSVPPSTVARHRQRFALPRGRLGLRRLERDAAGRQALGPVSSRRTAARWTVAGWRSLMGKNRGNMVKPCGKFG